MNEKNLYFPCNFIEHKNDKYSIVLSDFHYFDDYFGEKGAGGYTLDKLAKKLTKDNNIEKGIKFDSEAGMFCAYSKDKEKLLQLCKLLRKITGEEDQYITEENKALIPLDQAEKLLLRGFVISLDKQSQETFLENIPMPALSKKQLEYIDAIQNGTAKEKIYAAKRINSEARTKVRNWDHFLSHPKTISIFLKAIDKEENPKVYQELIWALVFICHRHLPDLRTQSYFLEALTSKIGTIRWLGLMGLDALYDFPFESVLPLVNDKTYKVRKEILSMIGHSNREFPIWMFDPIQIRVNNQPENLLPFFSLFNDKNRSVQIKALQVIERLEEKELFPELKQLIPVYKKQTEDEDASHIIIWYENVIGKLENIK